MIGGGDDAAVLDGGNGVVVLVDGVDVEYAIIQDDDGEKKKTRCGDKSGIGSDSDIEERRVDR